MAITRYCLYALLLTLAASASGQGIDEGRSLYQGRCLSCHGDGGAGGELGPNIIGRLADLDDAQVGSVILNGKPASGMPAFAVGDVELNDLVAYLRTFRPGPNRAPESLSVELSTGESIAGEVIGRSRGDAPDIDGKVIAQSDGTVKIGDLVEVRVTNTDSYDLQGVVSGEIGWKPTVPSWG